MKSLLDSKHIICTFMILFFTTFSVVHSGQLKPRLVVLTDIGPDDRESMIRLLVSADLFEIEALIATTGWNTGNYPSGWMDSIKVAVNAYENDLVNLMNVLKNYHLYDLKGQLLTHRQTSIRICGAIICQDNSSNRVQIILK